MQLSFDVLVMLTLVAGIAGFLDAMAGGGGLLTIPALLMANVPTLYTLGTNKLQATAGSLSASITMIRKGKIHPKQIWRSLIACFVGAVLGAMAVQLSPPVLLTKGIPFLIALIGIYYLFAPNIGEVKSAPRISKNKWQYGMSPLIGFYDGYLGPGTGMFFALGGITMRGLDMITATANAKLLNFTSNAASLMF
ncbi:TSUP family transporter, partial [Xanthomonas citri pv. citri]